jgi:hypothetical protein
MDASYVQSVTGTSLVEGLAAIVTHQPVSLALKSSRLAKLSLVRNTALMVRSYRQHCAGG